MRNVRIEKSECGRRPEPQAGAQKLQRGSYEARFSDGCLYGNHWLRRERFHFRNIHSRKRIPSTGGSEVLQLRSAHRGPVTRGVTNVQRACPPWSSLEGIVKQEECEEETNPPLPPECGKCCGALQCILHSDSLRTIVGLPCSVNRLPFPNFFCHSASLDPFETKNRLLLHYLPLGSASDVLLEPANPPGTLAAGQVSVFWDIVGGCDGQVFSQLGTR